MGEAIKIKEGGVDRSQNQINKLKTDLYGGGVCYWVPETERETDSKSITENGTYTAETEGLYGYSVLNVNVAATGGVSGKDNPGGGTDWDEYNVNVDENGYLVEKEIPSSITIVIPPTKTTYYDGDTIDYTGIEVVALDAHGEPWIDEDYPDGVIPFDELVFPVTTAEAGGGGGGGTYVVESYDPKSEAWELQRPDTYNFPVVFGGETVTIYLNGEQNEFYHATGNGAIYSFVYEQSGIVWSPIFISDAPFELTVVGGSTPSISEITIDGHKYYGGGGGHGMENYTADIPINHVNSHTVYYTDLIKLVFNGGGDTEQEIPVQWLRPEDYKQLEDTFEIEVQPVESGTAHGNEGNEGGGFEGGGSEHGF